MSDESIIASKISKYLDLDNFIIENYSIDKKIFNSAIISANDNIEIFAVNYISEFLKKHSIKVALSGLGADEIFYGYNKYYVAKKYEDENFLKK